MTKPFRPEISRVVELDDLEVSRSGDGRTVTAYIATWEPYAVVDAEGDYDEQIVRTAFNRRISRGIDDVAVIYNHGLDAFGRPVDFPVPVGRPMEIKPDGRGLLTVTRYNEGPQGDQIVEAIRNGALTRMSFRGAVFGTRVGRTPAGRVLRTRTELGLKEYSPVIWAANPSAEIVAVRSVTDLAAEAQQLSPEQRAELAALLSPTPPDGAPGATPAPDASQPALVAPEPGSSVPLLSLLNEQRRRRP